MKTAVNFQLSAVSFQLSAINCWSEFRSIKA